MFYSNNVIILWHLLCQQPAWICLEVTLLLWQCLPQLTVTPSLLPNATRWIWQKEIQEENNTSNISKSIQRQNEQHHIQSFIEIYFWFWNSQHTFMYIFKRSAIRNIFTMKYLSHIIWTHSTCWTFRKWHREWKIQCLYANNLPFKEYTKKSNNQQPKSRRKWNRNSIKV